MSNVLCYDRGHRPLTIPARPTGPEKTTPARALGLRGRFLPERGRQATPVPTVRLRHQADRGQDPPIWTVICYILQRAASLKSLAGGEPKEGVYPPEFFCCRITYPIR